MEFWKTTCLLLCCYGYFKELRPSEPFLTEYLTGPVQNLTLEQVLYEVFPVWTYSYMAVLVLVFLFTDFLRYKPVIVFEAMAYIATYLLLLFARGVPWMQFMEFCYGIVSATEVAYYTYMYAQVSGKHYQRVASFTRVAILLGRFSAAVLGQVLYSTGLMDPYSLNYISLGSFVFAFGFAVALPSVKHSIYFHRDDNILRTLSVPSSPKRESNFSSIKESVHVGSVDTSDDGGDHFYADCEEATDVQERSPSTPEKSSVGRPSYAQDGGFVNGELPKSSIERNAAASEDVGSPERIDGGNEKYGNETAHKPSNALPSQYTIEGFKKAMTLLWRDARVAYSNEHLFRWSFWSAVATCGFLQILNYIQSLYEKVLPDDASLYSGAVDAFSTASGTLAALSVAYISLDFGTRWEWLLGLVSFFQASLLTVMGVTSSIWVVYVCFIFYRVSHEFLITVASYQVARMLRSDTYGLVFGLNMFCALLLQTVLTVFVVEVFQVEIGMQFVVYGVYYACLSLLFLTLASYRLGRSGGCDPENTDPPQIPGDHPGDPGDLEGLGPPLEAPT
ncbi:Reduced folate carrier [Trinorchestia longiramus]|nr:Reduced folate carrier [Trinorchestia longiramus]